MVSQNKAFFERRKSVLVANPHYIWSTYRYPRYDNVIASESIDNIIFVGRTYYSRTPIGIPITTLHQHVLVLGATGSGKTTTAATIVNSLEASLNKQIHPIIIDWHGEYSALLKKYTLLDPYRDLLVKILDEEVEELGIEETLDIFEEVFELTMPQSYILYQCLERLYQETHSVNKQNILALLYECIRSYNEESSGAREAKYALLRKMAMLLRRHNINLFLGDKLSLLHAFYTYSNPLIIDVSKIINTRMRKFYVLLILKNLLSYAVKGLLKKKVLVVLEEAHNVLPRNKENSFLKRYIAEVRKYGITLLLVSQSPSNILEDAMKNTGTKIVHSIRSAIDLDIVMKMLKLRDELLKILPILEPGEAIFFNPVYKEPVLIKVATL